ncbi:MAG TPA: TetR/AcrR family transcriptional regulator [Rhizomicrobium sp.]|jgi:AcrR family transcriptional regulator|nr:TetR/AcrR family transcriptional regulator [Rhizomicrobium sp.]
MQNEAEETRPKGARDEKREAIVRTALEAFLAEGYAETSMSSVAAKVGGSKATLYNYFKSKEELFAAVVERKCEQIRKLLNEAEIEGGGDLKATLTNFGEHFVALLLSDDSIGTFRLATAEAARFPEIGRAIYNSGVRQNQHRVTELLEHARDAGRLRSDADVTCAAEQFLDLCLTGLHRRRLWNVTPCPSREEIRANVERAVTTFMRAFAV